MVSRVGRDVDGREPVARLGIGTTCIEEDPLAPTSTVNVSLGADGQPCHTTHENVAWDRLAGEAAARQAVATADAVYFGTLAQRSETSRRTISTLFGLVPPASLRIFDVNLRQHDHSRAIIEESLALADVLKLDETELPRLAALFHLSGDERAQVDALARRFALRVVAFTRGGRGSLLRAAGEWSVHPGRLTIVADTVGAGDCSTPRLLLLCARNPARRCRSFCVRRSSPNNRLYFASGAPWVKSTRSKYTVFGCSSCLLRRASRWAR